MFFPFFYYLCTEMEENRQQTLYRQSLKERILSTAIRAFAAQGIKAVKMDDIAQRLGISKRTLYETFENKEVLLFEAVKRFKSVRDSEMSQMAAQSKNVMDFILYVYRKKMEEFRTVSPAFYSDMERYPAVLSYLNEVRRQNRSNLLDFMHRGVVEGFFREDVDYELAAVMIEASTAYVMEHQLYKQYSLEQIFHNMLFVSLRGICTKRGQTMLDTLIDGLKESVSSDSDA